MFDFWDGRDGLVDAAKVGDFLRSLGLNPTEEIIQKNGGCKKMGKWSRHFDSSSLSCSFLSTYPRGVNFPGSLILLLENF